MKFRKTVLHICSSITAIILCLLGTFEVFADTVSYRDSVLWFSNKAYQTEWIESGLLEGYINYYFEENSLYCKISYSFSEAQTISSSTVIVSISNENRSYSIKFTEDSEDDFECDILKCFAAATSWGQNILFKLEFSDKEDKGVANTVEIQLQINSKIYNVTTVTSPYTEDETTTSSSASADTTSSSQSTTKSSAKETTTKFVYSGGYSSSGSSNSSSSSGSSSDATTKFSVDSNSASSSTSSYDESEAEDDVQSETDSASDSTDTAITAVTVEKETSLSASAKAMYALAAIFAACGAAFLIHYVVKSKKKKSVADDEDTGEDEPEIPDYDEYDEIESEAEIAEDAFDPPDLPDD